MQPATAAQAAPRASKRILLVDVLRAVALFGIIVNHITSGYLAGPTPPGKEQFNIFSPLDSALNTGSLVLTFGKFFTIFSFLFGLSFAIQLENARRKGSAFTGTFIWRLVILFAIGYIHNLFYSGDILVVYAVLGLLLLPARYLGNKVLLSLAILLILNVPGLIQDILQVNAPPPTQAQIAAQAEQGKGFATIAAEQFRTKQSGSLREVVQMNAVGGLVMKFFFQVFTGRLWITLGLFLLGMYAGRKKAFEYSASNARFFKRLLTGSGAVALLATVLALLYGSPIGRATTPLGVLGNFSFGVHQAALSTFYVSGIVLLYWRTTALVRLNRLAPVGQMGLTTYLMQSVFGLLVYYGFGLGMMGKIGATGSIALGIAFFGVQIYFANWWMARYRYGMVEWLWRSLTKLKLQPLHRSAEPNETEAMAEPVVAIVPNIGPVV